MKFIIRDMIFPTKLTSLINTWGLIDSASLENHHNNRRNSGGHKWPKTFLAGVYDTYWECAHVYKFLLQNGALWDIGPVHHRICQKNNKIDRYLTTTKRGTIWTCQLLTMSNWPVVSSNWDLPSCNLSRKSCITHTELTHTRQLGAVSLTFRELSKIFSRNLCIEEIVLLVRISSWNFVCVPKAMLWAHIQSFGLKFSP